MEGFARRAVTATIIVLGLVLSGFQSAHAGKNANGALVVHTDDNINYTYSGDYCGVDFDNPGSCEAAGTRTDKDEDTPAAIWVLAAFPASSTPGVTAAFFGISHNLPEGSFARWEHCGELEIPDPGWPETGYGTSVAFGSVAHTEQLFPIYFFAAYGGEGSYLGTAVNPGGGHAEFVDDSNPPVGDHILRFGAVRWYAQGSNDCPVERPEACCFPSGRCEVLLAADCASQGGFWQGPNTVPVACDPSPCTVVCCLPSGNCAHLSPGECALQAGVMDSTWTSCELSPCPVIPFGACCSPSGMCSVLTELECANADGSWMGAETTCYPDPCTEPQACCFADGSCEMLLPDDCQTQNGTPNGIGSVCDLNPCPQPQACCFADRSCQILLPEPCLAQSGTPMGDETACDPNPCPDPYGACCYPDEHCEYVMQSQCQGEFLGASSSCDQDPCTRGGHEVPVRYSTWGAIKALYR